MTTAPTPSGSSTARSTPEPTSADVTLSTEILDRIDELVAPGVTVNADDNSYGAAGLAPQARRR